MTQHPLTTLEGYKIVEVLASDSRIKFVNLHAQRQLDDGTTVSAVILLEQKPFEEDVNALATHYLHASTLNNEMMNDIYATYHLTPASKSEIKATVIVPATPMHVEKYRASEQHILRETPHDYKTLTLPYIEKQALNLKWVDNFINHVSESERIIYEDPDNTNGFLLAPDMKWTGQDTNSLYLLATVRRKNIRSIRDLTSEHLPLLYNIRSRVPTAVRQRYNVPASRLRLYFHYQPSFYHLHVHVVHIDYDAPGQKVGQAVLLDDVINNIEMMHDYYQKQTMTFSTKVTHPLYLRYQEAGRLVNDS